MGLAYRTKQRIDRTCFSGLLRHQPRKRTGHVTINRIGIFVNFDNGPDKDEFLSLLACADTAWLRAKNWLINRCSIMEGVAVYHTPMGVLKERGIPPPLRHAHTDRRKSTKFCTLTQASKRTNGTTRGLQWDRRVGITSMAYTGIVRLTMLRVRVYEG